MDRVYRGRMLRHAAVFLGVVVAALALCMTFLHKREFAIAALVIIPTSTVLFNLYERRSFAAYLAAKR